MIRVESKAEPYDVLTGRGSLSALPELLAPYGRVIIVAPEGLDTLRDRVVFEIGRDVIDVRVPQGEVAKTSDVLARCWSALAEARCTRNDVVVGVGGGATTDLAGFVAATWLRGIACVTVPTTVLAMVDAAVGGKTGINLPAGKNLVGAFAEPRGVICDFALLDTLPLEEVRAGMAEVVKCGFIKDPTILELAACDDRLDTRSDTFAELVERAVQVKASVVARDLREATSKGEAVGREALNYGHTLGHAIESWSGYRWRHGEAIAVGMCWVARVCQKLLGLSEKVVHLHDELLGGLGLPTSVDVDYAALSPIMSLDKKARGTTLRLVGLKSIGTVTMLEGPNEAVLQSAFADLISKGRC